MNPFRLFSVFTIMVAAATTLPTADAKLGRVFGHGSHNASDRDVDLDGDRGTDADGDRPTGAVDEDTGRGGANMDVDRPVGDRDGDAGRPAGGRPVGGRPVARPDGFDGSRPAADIAFVDDICEDTTPVPTCTNTRNGEGVWVCRSRTNPRTGETVSFSMCVPSDRGIEGVDECGCCGGECPAACTCGCIVTGRDGDERLDVDGNPMEGAYITVEGMDEDICVPKEASANLVERSNGLVSCASC